MLQVLPDSSHNVLGITHLTDIHLIDGKNPILEKNNSYLML
jgi:hypothetical protein